MIDIRYLDGHCSQWMKCKWVAAMNLCKRGSTKKGWFI